jgi:UDP-N-acetylmuramoylalanine--D-glutamate ligase
VKRVYTIGAAAAKIESQVQGTEIASVGTLEAAVKRASESASAGDVVLLAPACASFDQFDSYEHRGRIFKDLVRLWASKEQQREQVGSTARGGNE